MTDHEEYEDEIKELICEIASDEFDANLYDYDDAIDEIYAQAECDFEEFFEEDDDREIEDLLEDEDIKEQLREYISFYLEDVYTDYRRAESHQEKSEKAPVFLGGFAEMLERFSKPEGRRGRTAEKPYDARIDDFIDDMEGFAHEYADDFDSLSEAMDYFEDELEMKKRHEKE
ncbi:MAG: hypothetical protein IKE38_02290 [Erysipelotrichaceae bacterium]|nr:hypothetical protein [Erysipelotrichaceae bacterium]